MRVLIALVMVIFPVLGSSFIQDRERGWHWYETQQPEVDEQASLEHNSSSPQKSPKERLAVYREELENRLAQAWLHPTPSNVQRYITMQQDLTDRSKRFSDVWMQTIFLNPELDHTVTHPVNQRARHIQLDIEKEHVRQTIQSLSKDYGLFFFFSGSCQYCHAFAPLVKQFADTYGWDVLAISADGSTSGTFPTSVPDNGLIEQWQVRVLPALFAVNPHTGHVIPIAYGMTAIDQMEVRIMTLLQREKDQ